MTTPIWTAFAMGGLSSLHCFAMCGALAIGACSHGANRRHSTALYFGGRFISYAFLGAIFGQLGQHAACILSLRTVEIGAVFFLAAYSFAHGAILLRRRKSLVTLRPAKPGRRALSAFLSSVAGLIPRRHVAMGLLTGFLPCGMLASAWLLSASTASSASGALVMLAFATGSLPGLVAALIGKQALSARFSSSPRLAGWGWCALGTIVLFRVFATGAHCMR